MIEIVPYDQKWPVPFDAEAARIREFMGSLALRIEDVGSPSVAALAAKLVIDIQVSVASLETLSTHAEPAQGLNLLYSGSTAEAEGFPKIDPWRRKSDANKTLRAMGVCKGAVTAA